MIVPNSFWLHLTWCFLISFCFLTSPVSGQFEFTGKTMGPIDYRVVIHDSVSDSESLSNTVKERLDEINQLMSTYIDTSDVSRVNQSQADRWVNIDPLTLKVVDRSLEISKLTEGAFDITVGPAVKLWNFGPANESENLPNEQEIDNLKSIVSFSLIQTRHDPSSIRKLRDKTEIDLSAIAKGFAVDCVSDLLIDANYKNFMVEIGGEVYVRGETPNGPWKIGIEKPVEDQRTVAGIVEISHQALATSGDYRNFRFVDGKRISHTIDPMTCCPVTNSPASCSILADDCMTADAIATAILVMGEEKGIQFCRQNGFAIHLITRNETAENGFDEKSSSDFPIRSNPVPKLADQNGNKKPASIWPAFVGAVIVFSLAIAGMAVGAILNNKPITGSCGGIAATQNEDGSSSCTMCQKPVTECPDQETSESEC